MEALDLRSKPPRSCYAELDLEIILELIDADDRRIFGT